MIYILPTGYREWWKIKWIDGGGQGSCEVPLNGGEAFKTYRRRRLGRTPGKVRKVSCLRRRRRG